MTQLKLINKVPQDKVLALQEHFLANGDTQEGDYEHYFADGMYGRVMKIPAGLYAIGKVHRTKHLFVLLKGSATITNANDELEYIEAPFIRVVPGGAKKLVYCHTECWFLNIHATDVEDLAEIEEKVIMPEDEYKALLLERAADLTVEQQRKQHEDA